MIGASTARERSCEAISGVFDAAFRLFDVLWASFLLLSPMLLLGLFLAGLIHVLIS